MASGVANPNFYADFGALSSLGKQVKQKDPQAIREAARQFESLFTEMMLKSMRSAKLGNGLGESEESDFYQDMYDQQLAVQMSQGKGLGLADMLVRQLSRRGELGTADAAQAAASTTGSAGTASSKGGVGSVASVGSNGIASAKGSSAKGPTSSNGTAATGSGTSTRAFSKGARAARATRTTSSAPTTGKTGGGTSLSQRIGFVQKLMPSAQRAAAALGVSADTLIAQAALETGWGRHVVHGKASASSNNLFGVKASSAWQGTTASANTTEYSGGSAQRVTQSFRSYDSVQKGVNDYVSLLQRRAAYAGALGSGSDARAFAGALQRGGYATDPRYVEKLVATTATVRSLRSEVAAASAGGDAGADSALAAARGANKGAAAGVSFKVLAGVPIPSGEEPA